MAIRSRQIGQSAEANLLWDILKSLERLTQVAAASGGGGGGTGTVTSVTGTADRITITGTATVAPVVNIAATYTGQSSIVTTGTLTGGATGAGFTLNLTTSTLSGVLPIANGGTSLSTIAARSTYIANSANTLTTITPGAGQSIRINAGNTAWEAYTPVAVGVTDGDKGDITVSATGATWTIDNTVVTYAKMQNASGGTRIIGRGAGTSGVYGEITATADGQILRRAGGTLAFGQGTTALTASATNDAATAGNIGEEVNSTISTYTNHTTTATYQAITSISLTAGDWDISAFFTFSVNSATITVGSNALFVISTTTASAAGAVEGQNIANIDQSGLQATSRHSGSIGPYRVSISGTTSFFLNTQATFTVGNPQFVGSIRARRMR